MRKRWTDIIACLEHCRFVHNLQFAKEGTGVQSGMTTDLRPEGGSW